jgi:molecular chaperone DnaK
MGYALGIDLGTTWTAAAVARDGRVDIVQLGTHTASIPSVVLMREDGSILTGEAAVRRAINEPDRVAREFKRRLGDSTPLLLGGRPQSSEAVMGQLLRAVVDQVTENEGAAPDQIAITHPANWGEFKLDLLRQAVRLAGLADAVFLPEPEAAAIHYAASERIPDGAKVAVYDLGGGTFDAAILERHGDQFEILGPPEGIERLGGIDFDAAVLHHVMGSLEGDTDALIDDPVAASRLKSEAIAAKEALSSDTEVAVPILLPSVRGDIRLTRDEFENLIRPSIDATVAALERALSAAGVRAEDLHSVLLVGGSSRIPLVAEVVGQALGRPVAVDSHPKHVVPMGAALVAARSRTDEISPIAVAAAQLPGAPSDTAAVSSRRGLLVGSGAIAVVALLFAGLFAAGILDLDGTADAVALPGEETTTTAEPSSTSEPTTTTTRPTTTTTRATTTTTRATTTTTQPTTTTTLFPPASCNQADCIFIDTVHIVGGNLRIEWTSDFSPNTAAKHAHFFWDIYESAQVGTNAASFGVSQAPWELTANTTFVPGGEMALSNRPAGAEGVCVTAANGNHGVIDPANFHCVELPDS